MISCIATGDSLINRRLPADDAEVAKINRLMGEADVRFTNLETVIRRDEGFPSAQSGGTWVTAEPIVLRDLQRYGFNALAWANNHTLDYSYGGLEATQKYLDQSDFIHAGAGQNLAEASAIKYIECATGRVALIAGTSSFHESWIAGEQRPEIAGRPGVNPLRYQTIHRVEKAHLEHLRKIASVTAINDRRNLQVKEGFAVADREGTFRFGGQLFQLAQNGEIGTITRVNQTDMQRFVKLINQARRSADLVLISIHSHEMKEERKDLPADFLQEFAQTCIDSGADAIIGHGPHILRGIEIYKNRPIFYSLGDFIFQNETVARLPTDFYEKYGLGAEHNVIDALEKRSDNGKRGLGVNPDVWRSVIARWKMHDGQLQEISLFPITLDQDKPSYRRGWPRLTDDTAALENLRELSAPFGTEINIEKSVAKVLL